MKRSAPAVALVSLALLAAGCGGSSDDAGGSSGGGGGSKTIGLVTISATDSNNARVMTGV